MNSQQPQIATEISTDDATSSYDRWFRAKVVASLAHPGPGVPHAEVMARMDAIIAEARRKQSAGT
jgi:hypothetical protein